MGVRGGVGGVGVLGKREVGKERKKKRGMNESVVSQGRYRW